MNKKKYEKPAVIYTEYCGAPVSPEKVISPEDERLYCKAEHANLIAQGQRTCNKCGERLVDDNREMLDEEECCDG